MDKSLKRISLLIRQEQYTKLNDKNINLSGLIRDLMDDYLSDHKVTISVSEETKNIYDRVIANAGGTDEELEVYLRRALSGLLAKKIQDMEELKSELDGDTTL